MCKGMQQYQPNIPTSLPTEAYLSLKLNTQHR